MVMVKIESLLCKVESIRKKAENHHHNVFRKGNAFDVFSIVGLWDEEVNFHSAIIAELLDPHGSHGAGDLYLKLFLDILDCGDFPLCAEKVLPHSLRRIKERYIGIKTDSTGGRIDIIIEDGKHALIIENKPGYEDQEKQLLRYSNYAKNYEKSILVYLTKDGRQASKMSTGNGVIDYKCLSYIKLISWLDRCAANSLYRQNVRAIINQYKFHIKQLLGMTIDNSNYNDLLSLLTQKKNALAVKEILCVGDIWLNRIIEEFLLKPLGKYAESKNLHFDYFIEDEKGICIYKSNWMYYGIFLWTDKKTWNDMYVGVSYNDKPNRDNTIYKKDYSKLDCLISNPCDGWPYGWEYLPSGINYFGYDNADKIITGEIYNWIVQKINEMLLEIETRNLRMP